MKKIYLLIVLQFSVFAAANAQQWDWAKNVGREFVNGGSPVIKTNNAGDLFAAGTFFDQATVGDTTFYSDTSFYWNRGNYVARLTSSNQRIWAQQIGGQNTFLMDISVDAANNTYVLGYFANDLLFSDTSVYGAAFCFIAAFDPNGTRKWVRLYSAGNSGNFISNDGNGDLIYACALPASGVCNIRKISPANGNDLWVSTHTCNFSIHGLKCNSQNEIYFSGIFTGDTLAIDGVTYYQDTGYYNSSFLARVSSSGILQSVEVIPGPYAIDFDMDAQDNIYAIGSYEKKMKVRQLSFVTDTCYPNNCAEYFMVKLNTSGTASWGRKVHDEGLWQGSLAVAGNGDFYYSGSFLDSVNFDAVTLTETEQRDAIFIYKFNTNGFAQWAQKDEGGYLADVFNFDLAWSQSNAVYLCGNFHNYYARNWFGNDSLPYTGYNTHIFLARLTDAQLPSGIAELSEKNDLFALYPNPNNGTFTIRFAEQPADARISVRDVLGNEVFKNVSVNQLKQEVNPGPQARGLYFVEVISGNKKVVRKIIVE